MQQQSAVFCFVKIRFLRLYVIYNLIFYVWWRVTQPWFWYNNLWSHYRTVLMQSIYWHWIVVITHLSGLMYWPVTIYWESPEKAQSHIQPLDVSPGLLLLMLSSVISEKLDVLQILQVWSAEQVANRLEMTTNTKTLYHQQQHQSRFIAWRGEGGTHVESGLNLQRRE